MSSEGIGALVERLRKPTFLSAGYSSAGYEPPSELQLEAAALIAALAQELAERPDWPTVNITYEKWKARAEASEAALVAQEADIAALRMALEAAELKHDEAINDGFKLCANIEWLERTLTATIQPLEHASHCLNGIVSMDDEDQGKDGGSATCQAVKKTVDRALKNIRAALAKNVEG